MDIWHKKLVIFLHYLLLTQKHLIVFIDGSSCFHPKNASRGHYTKHHNHTNPRPRPMKSDLLDRRISDLENELANLRRRKVAELQEELNKLQADLNGTRPGRISRGWAAELTPGTAATEGEEEAPPFKSGGRRKHQSDEEVVDRLRKVVAASGTEGISARAAAEKAGVFYLRAIKVMGDSFVKSGAGKWTRYTIK